MPARITIETVEIVRMREFLSHAFIRLNPAHLISAENGRSGGSEGEASGGVEGEDRSLLGAHEELVQKKGML